MKFILRRETEADYKEVEALTREAFWDVYRPGCVEHLVLNRLRQSPDFIPELDIVAEADGKIVGNIVYSVSHVVQGADRFETLTFGPLSVLPGWQGKGAGQALVRKTLDSARKMGFRGVIIFGHPGYYSRFGFENAEKYGITTADGQNLDAFMALELAPGALRGVSGRFEASDAFNVDGRGCGSVRQRLSSPGKARNAHSAPTCFLERRSYDTDSTKRTRGRRLLRAGRRRRAAV